MPGGEDSDGLFWFICAIVIAEKHRKSRLQGFSTCERKAECKNESECMCFAKSPKRTTINLASHHSPPQAQKP